MVAWMVFVDWLSQQQFLCSGLCCHFQIFAYSYYSFSCDHHVFIKMLVRLYRSPVVVRILVGDRWYYS
jgi:hypothetical protein